MTAAERVRKHREKRRIEHCDRLDVWISGGLTELLQQLAVAHGRGMREEVQDAVAWYVGRRLNLSGPVTLVQAREAIERYRTSHRAASETTVRVA